MRIFIRNLPIILKSFMAELQQAEDIKLLMEKVNA